MSEPTFETPASNVSHIGGLPFVAPNEPDKCPCENCGAAFTPRKGTGGKPQRFCSPECRTAFHTEAQRLQRGPTCEQETSLPAAMMPPAPQTEQEAPAEDAFDWGGNSTILTEQLAVAAYLNQTGELVIRQERAWDRDEDSLVFVSKENIAAFVDNLLDILGYGSAGRR